MNNQQTEDYNCLKDLLFEEANNKSNNAVSFSSNVIVEEGGTITVKLNQWEKTAINHFTKKYGSDKGNEIFSKYKKMLRRELFPQGYANDL